MAVKRKRPTRPKTITTPPRTASGIIRSEWAYRIPAFCEDLGIARQRLSDMRERGLPIREDGKYRIILGSDYLDRLKTLPDGCDGTRSFREDDLPRLGAAAGTGTSV